MEKRCHDLHILKMSENNKTIYVQSAGGVVVNRKGEVLIVNQHGNSWSLPKGHIEAGEEALVAARREIEEESGLKNLNYIKSLGSYARYRLALDGGDDKSEHKTLYFFLFTTDDVALKPIDPENPEARWVAPSDVTKFLSHKEDRAFFERVLKENSL